MNTLHLTLKKKPFTAIASGEKLEEYREDKPYWRSRLRGHPVFKKFDRIIFTNGYGANRPRLVVEHLGTGYEHLVVEGLSGGKSAWYFVLKLGRILEYTSASITLYPVVGWKPVKVIQA